MKDKFDKKIELAKSSKIVIAIVTFLIIAFSLVCGFFVNSLVMGSKRDSVSWAIGMIEKHGCYYDEESGTIKEFSANDYLQMITENLDTYSDYFTKEENDLEIKTNQGNFYGNGMYYLYDMSNEKFFVRKVIGNSPADHGGFMVGDTILAVEDNGEIVNFSNNYTPIDFLNKSEENVEYTYHINRKGEQIKLSCKRGVYKANFVKYYDKEKSMAFVSENNQPLQTTIIDSGLSYLDNDTALIELEQFEGNAVSGIKTVMAYLKERQKTKLILDLRGNGGGNINVLSQIASYFIHKEGDKKPLIFIAKNKYDDEERLYASGDNFNQNLTKIIVLANEYTASASESLIGAMLYHKTLTVENLVIEKHLNSAGDFVATTYGKGIMQTTFTRAITGEAIKLTTAVVYQPDGVTTIHKKGITTTSLNGVERGKAMDRAIELLG